MLTLEDHIENDIGIPGFAGVRLFYPRKPRSCKDCHFCDFDTHSLKRLGCSVGFPTEHGEGFGQRPTQKCYPVMDDTNSSSTHADSVSCYLAKLQQNKKD